MRSSVSAIVAWAALASGQAILRDFCDAEYECEYRSPDFTRSFYDLKPLCLNAIPYTTPPSPTGWTIKFQVCGEANVDCVPPYTVTYNRGGAVQFLDSNVNPGNCSNAQGQQVPCTSNCEVIGVGTPVFTVFDVNNPGNGVNMTYYGVPDQSRDGFECPINPATKGPFDRKFKLVVLCDPTADTPTIDVPVEDAVCSYVVTMRSKYGCACQPYCYGNCGPSNCPGVMCGVAGSNGGCPFDQSCATDSAGTNYCCAPDCRGRQCGDDGCGGSCGFCSAGQRCSRSQQCVAVNVSPSPAPVVQVSTRYTTSSADVFASWIGGVLAAGVGTLGFGYFRKVRQTLYSQLDTPLV